MILDSQLFWTFFLVFVRTGALLSAAPFFGAQNVPVKVRVLMAGALAACLTLVVQPHSPRMPSHWVGLIEQATFEALAGLLIGAIFSLILHAVQMAGSLSDLQIGFGSSQVLNPVSGVPVTIIAQFKLMLGLIVFVSVDGHHVLLESLVASYRAAPPSVAAVEASILPLLQAFCLLSLQIAAPVIAVTFVVDAALGLVNKAVPSMQVFFVGLPAKILIGLLVLSLALPATVSGVERGVDLAAESVARIFGG